MTNDDDHYARCSFLSGPISDPADDEPTIAYRQVIIRGRDRIIFTLIFVLYAVTEIALVSRLAWSLVDVLSGHRLGFVAPYCLSLSCIVLVELLRFLQGVGLWLFALVARDPVPFKPDPSLRVAMVTTIVPAYEPIEMVEETLRAMRAVRHDGHVDVWILDEGDDPTVRARAAVLGVRHFSRCGRPKYNSARGEFRVRTKSGNHNAWRAEHGKRYDVVAQVDPDHAPRPEFLERTLGYFRDPDVGFVVAPQVYGNHQDGFVARAAAAQSYVFTGVIQRGGNGLGAPLLIGTNHVYRMRTWEQVGGYQDSIIEDHLTSMVVHASVNPITGNRWKGVYTPDILAVGQGPMTWTDFFRQQRRWAFGIWEILTTRTSSILPLLAMRQRVAYTFHQLFYPSVGLSWLLTNFITVCYLIGLVDDPAEIQYGAWLWTLWISTVLSWLALLSWLRQVNLVEHERRESVFWGILITAVTAPVYASAGISALLRRRLEYAVTAKGQLRSKDTTRTFRPHLISATVLSMAMLLSNNIDTGIGAPYFFAGVGLVTCLAAPAGLVVQRIARVLRGTFPLLSCRDGLRRILRRHKHQGRERRRRDRLVGETTGVNLSHGSNTAPRR
jgi:cellulose synthase/poly-beta-1,6-N-acetylglucosamine synthase-like glycosyltransferase